ncbi:MAG: S-layer homology domain-containing protein [Peptococcaceae bacterium]|nr:S-layer homology domain-containing protein [Peptococcaceae bacterium]
MLTLTGAGFGTVGGSVYLAQAGSGGGSPVVQSTYSSWSGTQVKTTVPADLSPGGVSAAVYSSVYGMSNSLPFLVTPSGVTETAVSGSTTSSGTPATAGTAATTGSTVAASGGTGTVTTGDYNGDPAGAPAFVSVGSYFDVSLSYGNTFTSMVITKYGASSGDTMYWWNGSTWIQVSPAGNLSYDAAAGTLSFTVTGSTTPDLADLTGTPFVLAAPATTPSQPVSSGGGGGGSAPPALAVSTTTLPAATVGQPYSATIATNNEGTPPYTFAVTSGTLPAGLTLTAAGVVSGTPATAGSYPFTITVKDVNNNTASQSYTLTVGSVSVTPPAVTPPAVTPPTITKPTSVSFSDIATSWARTYILELAKAGVINGYPDGTFRPDNYVTRAEFVKMLVLAAKLPLVTNTGNLQKYADFASFQPWELPYLATAVKAGIINGYPDGTLRPASVVDRIQMAAMVGRTLAGVTGVTLTFKDDAAIPTWGKGPLSVDVAKGLINGLPNGMFGPGLPATRAQAAKVLALYMGL